MTGEKFRDRVMAILDEEVVLKFDKRLVDADVFYEEEDEEATKESA